MTDIAQIFQLDACLDWIIGHGFKRVAIQLKLENLKHSMVISQYLKENYQKTCAASSEEIIEPLDLYITQSSTCCVDLLVTQHVSNLDAIIHIGKVCLSKPEIKNQPNQPPVLFAFGQADVSERVRTVLDIADQIKSICESIPSGTVCLIYDTDLTDYVIDLQIKLAQGDLPDNFEIAFLKCPSDDWYTTHRHRERFFKKGNESDLGIELISFGPYLLKKPIDKYSCVIQLGDLRSIQLTLQGPSKHIKIKLLNSYLNDIKREEGKKLTLAVDTVDVSRLLNRRIALVNRLKDEEELKIGVLITNPLPDITSVTETLESHAKARKHALYFISMIQTIDECKIGNFDLCDAFIVINSCSCSTILESLVFNRPIITELEFKLACGFEADYGRVLWPGSSSHLSADDMINKRKVSDVTIALAQTRNELLERCSQARTNKWSGLEYKASEGNDGGCGESLKVEEGLKGIASSYNSEPLKKDQTPP